ncbi:tyrosine-protein phosphatase non-receptor type substrate 1-like [Leptodactylus fuscus]|uniref:tyrosine-protein phosphatase non-receptor type substrate 1-like n=1 Tax=Leptodactylus fuscus TaxID=238119 RepID=UPI003F4E9D68
MFLTMYCMLFTICCRVCTVCSSLYVLGYVLCILCLYSSWPLAQTNSPFSTPGMPDLSVFQSPPSLVIAQGQNASLGCFFSVESNVKGAVSWHRAAALDGNMSISQVIHLRSRFSLAHPKTFLSEGDASLVISQVTREDAGTYFCKVHMWEKAEAQGSGTKLLVYAPPSQPEIFLKVATKSQEDMALTCQTSGYYPAGIAISWHSSHIDLPDPGPVEIWKSENGDFQAARRLVLPSHFRANLLTLSCVVEHLSLPAPIYANYSYDLSEFGLTSYQLIEYLNILKIALILALTICILLTVRKRCKIK